MSRGGVRDGLRWMYVECAFAVFGLVWLSHALWKISWDPYGRKRVYAVGCMALAWLAWRRREVWNALKGCWPALLPVALALLSAAWSIRPDRSFRYACGLFATTCLGLFLATRFDLKQQVNAVALAFGGIVLASLLLVAVVPDAGMMSGDHAGAWRGLFFNRNSLAPVAVLGAVAYALLALDRAGPARLLAWLGTAVCALAAAGSRSRGAWIIGPVALVAALLLPRLRSVPRQSLRRGLILSAISIGALALLALPHLDTLLAPIGRDHTLSGRTRIWEHSLNAVATRPWLGFGYRAFWRWAPEADAIEKALEVSPEHRVTQGHAVWMDLALDLGWVGVAFFAAGLAVVVRRTLIFTWEGRGPISLWPALCLLVLLAFAQLEPFLFRPAHVQWALYVALAAVVSTRQER